MTLVRFDVSCSAVVRYAGRFPLTSSAYRALSRRASDRSGFGRLGPLPPARCTCTAHATPRPGRHPPPRNHSESRGRSWQLPRTRTRVARHTPHTLPKLARAHRVAHFRRHTSFTSCGHAALTTSTPTHSPHTGARPAPVVGGTAPHPARPERTTRAAPSLSRSCVATPIKA